VVVDDTVPVLADRRHFAFAGSQGEDDVWPLLLEKGFAKMFGSYMKIVAGRVYDSFKAVTQAPVDLMEVDKMNASAFWGALVDAERHLWPISGSARNEQTKIGTATGHQFVILETSQDHEGHGKAIRVYNPWAKNSYTGALSQDRTKGDYWLTYAEFRHAFSDVTVARVQPGYQISSRQVKVGIPTLLQFTMATDKPFAVQLEWPTSRFLPEGCSLQRPHFELFVAKTSDLQNPQLGEKAMFSHISNARADLAGGAGDYAIYVYADFEGAPWLEEVVINTYAAEKVTITPVVDYPADQFAAFILGFDCDDLLWTRVDGQKNHSSWFTRRDSFRGSPAWKELTGDGILWFRQNVWQISVSESNQDSVYSAFEGPSQLRCTQAHPRFDCDDILWVDEKGRKERFRRRAPVQGSPAWRHVSRDDMILLFAGQKEYKMIGSEADVGSFYPSFKGPSHLRCAEPIPRFDDCEHLVWTTAAGNKERYTRRKPLQGSAAWKHAMSSKILWFADEAEYRVIPSESQLDRFYSNFEGPSQLKCVDKDVMRFTCETLRRTTDDGSRSDMVRRSPFLGAPAWKSRSGKLLWFNTDWVISPSERDIKRIYSSFKPEQLQCLRFSFLQEAEVNATPTAEDTRLETFEQNTSAAAAQISGSVQELAQHHGALRSNSLVEAFHSLNLEGQSADQQMSGQDPSSCLKLLDRLAKVGEQDGEELAESMGEDPLFPPAASSITAADDVCTDVDGRPTSCKDYSWGRIPDTLERFAEVGRCIAAKRDGDKCQLKNICRTSINLHWFPQVLKGDGGFTVLSFRDVKQLCETHLPEASFERWSAPREEKQAAPAAAITRQHQQPQKQQPQQPQQQPRARTWEELFSQWY